jgi:hypothetical protein
MNISKLNKVAGIAAILSCLLFIIQFIHPANELASLTTANWMIAHVLNFFFPILGILGITGIYLNQAKEAAQYAASALSILDGKTGPAYIGSVYQINGILYLLG